MTVPFTTLALLFLAGCTSSDTGTDTGEAVPAAIPVCEVDSDEGTVTCENGLIRVRTTVEGITWFDIFHAGESIWYVNKNNIQYSTHVPGGEWLNSELTDVTQTAEVLAASDLQTIVRLTVGFTHGAEIAFDMTMDAGSSFLRFELHAGSDSEPIDGFQWHVTFGQAEAVAELSFDGNHIIASELPAPFPGDSLEAQYVEWFSGLSDQEFYFSGEETAEPDPANPSWMTRVLGLEQHISWDEPMAEQDLFAFEARDRPWQSTWGVPETIPWIEGLWFVRPEGLVEGDTLIYGIDNMADYR